MNDFSIDNRWLWARWHDRSWLRRIQWSQLRWVRDAHDQRQHNIQLRTMYRTSVLNQFPTCQEKKTPNKDQPLYVCCFFMTTSGLLLFMKTVAKVIILPVPGMAAYTAHHRCITVPVKKPRKSTTGIVSVYLAQHSAILSNVFLNDEETSIQISSSIRRAAPLLMARFTFGFLRRARICIATQGRCTWGNKWELVSTIICKCFLSTC